MGYLDYAGLQYLWGKLKEKFAPKSHSHDDRYYTEAEMDGKLNSKSNTNHTHDASTLINALGAGTAAPTDPDYVITQWVGGGTSNTTWVRRPMSSIWSYIKSKADSIYQPKGSYAASSHNHDSRYYTEAEVDGKLSVKAESKTLSKVDLNTVKTPGFYSAAGSNDCTNVPVSDAFGLIVTHNAGGEYYTQIFFLINKNISYRRYCNGGTWTKWTEEKLTDTNTWRGIQNNLTSDSTTDSLSAAQGKVLKTLVDGKAVSNHTHKSVIDNGNGSSATTFAYSKSGMNYGDYTWLAAWNGYELRAVNKSQFAPSAHNQSWSTITDKPALMESGDYSAETIEALLNKVQGLSPRMGSCNFTKDTHVANIWWNFIYTPHRTGSGMDNADYGTLLLFPMTGVGSSYIIRAGKDGTVREVRKIYTSSDKPTKGDVGLGNVDNTADANKSVKYATSAGSASTAIKATTADNATTATTSKSLQLLSTRPTSMNFNLADSDYNKKITYSIASSSTKEGKPPQDCLVTTYAWDSNGYGAQVAVERYSNPRMYVRGATNNNGTSKWDTSWKTVAFTDDKPATAGTADNATKLGGLSPSKDGDKTVWGTVPTVSSSTGVTELGRYLDFHSAKDSSVDYDVRITAETTGLTITGTTKGTFSGNLTGNASTATKAISADKATSASSADKAAKLTTARTVSGGSDITLSFNYDGSANSTANIGFYSCKHSVGSTNNYLFHRFAKLENLTGAYTDKAMLVYITQDYNFGGFGICRLSLRTNNSSSASSVEAKWLIRRGLSADFVQVAIYNVYGKTYADAFIKINGTYGGTTISALESGGRAAPGRTWTLVDSKEADGTTATDKKTSSECWKTIADAGNELHKQAYSSSAPAVDEGYVASAGSANSAGSCTGNSASATKLTSSAGSATQPVYFKDGKPVAGTYTLGDASSKMVRTLSAQGNSGWANQTTDDKYVPTMSFMAYWNGAYGGTSSNLQYCDRGRFGTIVTKNSGDYASAGHTHNYAGSGSVGGSANSAVKLDSSAGSNTQPVYFSGGKPVAIGYTIASSVPANAKFTDTTYGVATSSSNGLMSSTDKTKLDDFSRVISIQKQIKLTTDWQDTGIAGTSLDTGTYVVQVSGFNSSYTKIYSEIYSGVISWYSGATNSGNSSEIFLHNAGHADNNAIYLRTLRTVGQGSLKLQIACKTAATGTDTLTFKFRRLI